MSSKRRRVIYNSLIVASFFMIVGLINYFNMKSTIVINFIDENGTPVMAPLKAVGRVNSTYKLNIAHLPGYTLGRYHYELKYTYGEVKRNVVYHPKTMESLTKLLQAKYVGVSAQDVTTNSSDEIQSVSYDHSHNRLRVLYADKMDKWHTFTTNYPNVEIQDPTLFKLGNFWFVAYSGGVLRSTDLSNWDAIETHTSKRYQEIMSPSLVHLNNKTSMVFTASVGDEVENYIAPFDYVTGQPNLKKAKQIKGTNGESSSLSLYKGKRAYYLAYSEKASGVVYIKKSKKITGKYQLVRKIIPKKGSYYYAPGFALDEAGKVKGLTYSSYYYNDSNDLAYNGAFFQSKVAVKAKPILLRGDFAFQKFGLMKLGAD
ncbi:MucBP domain-containing protein [Levilactobacillus fujinensis]|uniref:MucBP domain-containing protein n=1 Tax=Levilactobacillus fujinensis TaxID=2486024 RepID=A0ABW1TH55_9LACO|nr:MucBP domain-containing protein [Levilactobacillus fujinensis]